MSGTQRVFPADVYDALELGALAYGGIGRGSVYDDACGLSFVKADQRGEPPLCAFGILAFVAGESYEAVYGGAPSSVLPSVRATGLGWSQSDRAVSQIQERLRLSTESRVTFEDWCRELNVVRGES